MVVSTMPWFRSGYTFSLQTQRAPVSLLLSAGDRGQNKSVAGENIGKRNAKEQKAEGRGPRLINILIINFVASIVVVVGDGGGSVYFYFIIIWWMRNCG